MVVRKSVAGTECSSAGCFHRDAGFEFLYEAHQETAVSLVFLKMMPCMGVYKAPLTLSPSGNLTAELERAWPWAGIKGIPETNTVLSCQAANSACMKGNQ